MPRKTRETAITGIYHVMLRGINKQDIFFDEEDYLCMMRVLMDAPTHKAPNGEVVNRHDCTIYAFCILPNHVHVLIREGIRNISELMKKIEDRYVFFYNSKYERSGHLFQDRFRSEPVDNADYFHTLLRYIHRNPVKALLCNHPEDYPYSSWREYVGSPEPLFHIVNVASVLNSYEYTPLVEWVNLDVDDDCLDMDKERFILSDKQALEMLEEISGTSNVEEFKQLTPMQQFEYLCQAMHKGMTMRQASRLSTLSYSKLQREMAKVGQGVMGQGVRPLDPHLIDI